MFFLYALTIILTHFGYPVVRKILIKHKLLSQNYSGNKIPLGYGLLLVVNSMIFLLVGEQLKIYSVNIISAFLFLIFVVGLVGLIDDYFGDKKSKGFRGHLKQLVYRNKITTGLLKAILVSGGTLLVVINFANNFWLLVINFLLVVLMTNFINLLDLRPGRALKGFILLTLIFYLITNFLFKSLVAPLLIMTLLLLPIDLKEEAMLGDVGSNLLGAFLGLSLVISLELFFKIIVVLLLFIIHLYTEKFSLTEYIKQNKILSYIDKLGRNKI